MKKLAIVVMAFAFVVTMGTSFAATPAKAAPKKATTAKAAPAPKAAPVKAEKITVNGAVSTAEENKKKVTTITGDDGVAYTVAGAKSASLAKMNGKKVKALGTVKELNGKKVLTVSSFTEQK